MPFGRDQEVTALELLKPEETVEPYLDRLDTAVLIESRFVANRHCWNGDKHERSKKRQAFGKATSQNGDTNQNISTQISSAIHGQKEAEQETARH